MTIQINQFNSNKVVNTSIRKYNSQNTHNIMASSEDKKPNHLKFASDYNSPLIAFLSNSTTQCLAFLGTCLYLINRPEQELIEQTNELDNKKSIKVKSEIPEIKIEKPKLKH